MAVRVTPTATVTHFTCGRLSARPEAWTDGQPGHVVVVAAYLIEHPAGLVVLDTGLGPRFARPMGEARGRPAEIAEVDEDELIDARLRAVGVDPAEIGYVLNSHLHSGHAGGNALLPNASIVVQRAEWDHATTTTERDYHFPEFDTGQPVNAIVGEYDVFGDGSIVLIPTPGHTPGHQSAHVHTEGGQVILAGNAVTA